eukprot:s8058_g3.t1
MSSEQKILLGPPSAHASVTFTRAPEPSKAEARSERSDSHESQPSQPSRPSPSRLLAVLSHSSSPRGPSGARSSVSSTYPGGAQSPVFAYHTHIQQKVPPAEVAWQRGSSLELQLPPPPRSSPARDSELRPADLKLTVLTSDSRLETLMFRSDGNFEKQALEFLMQKKLKALRLCTRESPTGFWLLVSLVMRARLVLVFAAHHVHRRLCNTRSAQRFIHSRLPPPLPLLIQPYVLFHSVFVFLLCESLVRVWDLMQASNWLDPSSFRCGGAAARGTPGAIMRPLRWMALACPPVTIVTSLVTLRHLWRHHVAKERTFDKSLRWYPSHSHDLAMQVATMPLIYGVFALDCVIQMLLLLTGSVFREFKSVDVSKEQLRHLTQERYGTNLELADLYEAWALYNFGRLCLMRVRRQIRQEIPLLRRSLTMPESEHAKLLIFRDPERFLFRPLEVTTGIGVKIFVYTCAVKSLFALTITFFADAPFHINLSETVPWALQLLPHMDGAAFMTSTIAILSLIAIEHGFHEILQLQGFAPVLKFLGVKALVTITCLQTLVMGLVMQRGLLRSDEASLCYACLLCFEVLPLALLTAEAWKPRYAGDWYDADCGWGEGNGHLGRLAGEGDWAESYAVLPGARLSAAVSRASFIRQEDSKGEEIGSSELVRWNSFCELKRVW